MAAESKKAVVAAIVGNAAIAVIKFVAGAMTGSSAMISEGIHSLVDTGNGGLLFHGLRRGAQPADDDHPFGHGMEVYFWSLIVAISIFGIGGGMSIYEGITHIQHPSTLENPTINYIVLALAMVFESVLVQRRLARLPQVQEGSRHTLAAIHHGKDPSLFTVLFEDTAALLGLVVAFLGVFLSHQLDAPVLDGAASVVIGLHPRRAPRSGWPTRARACSSARRPTRRWSPTSASIALADPAVIGLGAVLTMHLGPDDVLLNIEVQFTPGLPAEEIHAAVHRIEERISEPYPEVSRIFIEVEALGGARRGVDRRGDDCAVVRARREAQGVWFRPCAGNNGLRRATITNTGTHPPFGRTHATARRFGVGRRCVRAHLPGEARRSLVTRRLAGVTEVVVLLRQVCSRSMVVRVLLGRESSAAALAGEEFEGAAPDRPRGGRVLHRNACGGAGLVAGAAADTVHGRRLAERRTHALALAATADRERVVAKGGAHAHAELTQDAVGEGRVGDGSEQWRRDRRAARRARAGPAHPGRAAAAAAGSWRGACGCAVSPSPRRDRPTPGSRTRWSAGPSRDRAGAPP